MKVKEYLLLRLKLLKKKYLICIEQSTGPKTEDLGELVEQCVINPQEFTALFSALLLIFIIVIAIRFGGEAYQWLQSCLPNPKPLELDESFASILKDINDSLDEKDNGINANAITPVAANASVVKKKLTGDFNPWIFQLEEYIKKNRQ